MGRSDVAYKNVSNISMIRKFSRSAPDVELDDRGLNKTCKRKKNSDPESKLALYCIVLYCIYTFT